jgi:hypothetical protein
MYVNGWWNFWGQKCGKKDAEKMFKYEDIII